MTYADSESRKEITNADESRLVSISDWVDALLQGLEK